MSPPYCPACNSVRLEFLNSVDVAELGYCWAMDRLCGGKVSHPSQEQIANAAMQWASRIREAIQASQVSIYRCKDCYIEVASPTNSWPEGLYTEDENYPLRWEFSRFLSDLGPKPLRILELGCGTGMFMDLAKKCGHSVVGIDFSAKAVGAARSKGHNVICGGFDKLEQSLSKQDLIFDAVAMFHVIEHLPEPSNVLAELSRFVKHGSLLGISCPGPRRFTRHITVQQVQGRDFWDFPPHHVLRWNSTALSMFLERNSWSVIRSVEEPLVIGDAAAQWGVTHAMWRGFLHSPIKRRLAILGARAQLLLRKCTGNCAGLSLFTLSSYRSH